MYTVERSFFRGDHDLTASAGGIGVPFACEDAAGVRGGATDAGGVAGVNPDSKPDDATP